MTNRPVLRSCGFASSQLRRVAPAEAFNDPREPPLRCGDVISLNSGGPRMLVVDEGPTRITAAVAGGEEFTFPRACVHRVRLT